VACPYFCPTQRIEQKLWPHPARLPLGDGYAGICRADPSNSFQPGENSLRECCNLGYARQECERFPADSGPDAVRFAIASDTNGTIRILYVIEKDHRPYDHGSFEFARGERVFLASHPNQNLQRQAEAYLGSYLRRTK